METNWLKLIRKVRPDVMAGMFCLERKTDVTGVSGTGTVAYGAYFPNGKVALAWVVEGKPQSVVIYDSFEDMFDVHTHDGKTGVVWLWQQTKT